MAAKVLILAGGEAEARNAQRILAHAGFEVEVNMDAREAMARLPEAGCDVVLADVSLCDVDAQSGSGKLCEDDCGAVLVVMAVKPQWEAALGAVQRGAFDFVILPIADEDDFVQHIRRAAAHKALRDSRGSLRRELERKNVELENRLSQLELAHSVLQSQAVAIQMDLNRALRIQYGLLPRTLPFADRISAATLYRPMAKVGGDLYDMFELKPRDASASRRVAFYIADTSGHGVSSAMLTVFLKYAVEEAVRAAREDGADGPGEILRLLNQTVLGEAFGQGVFVSMAFMVLDVDAMRLAFSNAGHPPMLLRRADGAVERFRHPAPVLGVNPKVSYTCTEVDLARGDAIILFTDGVTDARDVDAEPFGEERLRESIRAADGHAKSIVERIATDLAAFSEGAQQADDATLVVIGAEPQRSPFHGPKEPPPRVAAAGPVCTRVQTATLERRTFIAIAGAGSWRECQQVLDLCKDARGQGVRSIILDLSSCAYLDSTFFGVLHNIASNFEDDANCTFEIQGASRALLRGMSELGLTAILLHFRHEPLPLPDSMAPVEGGAPAGEEMGRLLLWAHESLVEADPTNADRFAGVLKVLHDRVKGQGKGKGAPTTKD